MTEMVRIDRVRRQWQIGKMSGRFRSYWLLVFECPQCKARKFPAANAAKRKKYYCDCGA